MVSVVMETKERPKCIFEKPLMDYAPFQFEYQIK